MKRLLFVALSVVVILSMLLSGCSASSKIRVATDATYPPFESVDEKTKELVGFDIELMKAVAKKAGFEVEFVNLNFDPLLAGMAQCQYDVAISAMTITEERKKSFLFSDPYINAGQIVAVKKDNTTITGPESLTGKKIGVQIGTTGEIEAKKIANATVKTYDTVDLAFLDLGNGQVDAVVADDPTTRAFVAKNSDKLKTVGKPFTDENYGIAVCNKKPELLAKINTALAALKADGTITALDEKWVKGLR
ncbi:MAG TPA: basic amino acid ABC transporter substrate-binding protein [Anaerolineaceae bacterium]